MYDSEEYSGLKMWPGEARDKSTRYEAENSHTSSNQSFLLGDIDRLMALTNALPMPDDAAIQNGSMAFLQRQGSTHLAGKVSALNLNAGPKMTTEQEKLGGREQEHRKEKLLQAQTALLSSMEERMSKFSKYLSPSVGASSTHPPAPVAKTTSSSSTVGINQHASASINHNTIASQTIGKPSSTSAASLRVSVPMETSSLSDRMNASTANGLQRRLQQQQCNQTNPNKQMTDMHSGNSNSQRKILPPRTNSPKVRIHSSQSSSPSSRSRSRLPSSNTGIKVRTGMRGQSRPIVFNDKTKR